MTAKFAATIDGTLALLTFDDLRDLLASPAEMPENSVFPLTAPTT